MHPEPIRNTVIAPPALVTGIQNTALMLDATQHHLLNQYFRLSPNIPLRRCQ
jgi:hypothetical protein